MSTRTFVDHDKTKVPINSVICYIISNNHRKKNFNYDISSRSSYEPDKIKLVQDLDKILELYH